jgi:transposase InsO family protein
MGIKPKRTRPYRPRTNGKIERFHRTMADGWAFRRMFPSELARRQALPAWLHEYNGRVRLFACSRVSALHAETKGLRWFARLQPAAGWLAQ